MSSIYSSAFNLFKRYRVLAGIVVGAIAGLVNSIKLNSNYILISTGVGAAIGGIAACFLINPSLFFSVIFLTVSCFMTYRLVESGEELPKSAFYHCRLFNSCIFSIFSLPTI